MPKWVDSFGTAHLLAPSTPCLWFDNTSSEVPYLRYSSHYDSSRRCYRYWVFRSCFFADFELIFSSCYFERPIKSQTIVIVAPCWSNSFFRTYSIGWYGLQNCFLWKLSLMALPADCRPQSCYCWIIQTFEFLCFSLWIFFALSFGCLSGLCSWQFDFWSLRTREFECGSSCFACFEC